MHRNAQIKEMLHSCGTSDKPPKQQLSLGRRKKKKKAKKICRDTWQIWHVLNSENGQGFLQADRGKEGWELPFLLALLSKEHHLGQPELEMGALQGGLVAVMGLGAKGRTGRLLPLEREELGQQQLCLSSAKLRKEKRVVALE